MTILVIFLLSTTGFFTLYLILLTVVGFFYKDKTKIHVHVRSDQKRHKFAVIIPAYNEERVIEQTVTNLLNINYPKELFQVFVVADNCSDKTYNFAYKAGAVVLERENREFKGKGYALRWCFELLLKSHLHKNSSPIPFDAFLVIDADTTASKNILDVLNLYLNSGYQAIQCADLVKPKPGSWSSEITRVGLYLYNYVRPLGKKMLNLSAGLRGNGMCFTKKLLEKVPWQSYSQTEDLEYGLHLLLNDIPVTFAPEAKVFALMPADPRNAVTQRARWEFGRFPLIKKYFILLLKEALWKRSLKIFDAFVELITPAFVNLFLITILMLVLSTVFTITKILSGNIYMFLWGIIFFLQLFYVLGGLYLSKADIHAYKALWKAPKFVVWKLVLYFKLLKNGRTNSWIRTTRENSVS